VNRYLRKSRRLSRSVRATEAEKVVVASQRQTLLDRARSGTAVVSKEWEKGEAVDRHHPAGIIPLCSRSRMASSSQTDPKPTLVLYTTYFHNEERE
jgi:hypothetical protein